MKIKDKVIGFAGKIFNSLAQGENRNLNTQSVVTEGMPEMLRYAAAQGAVLLKNDGTLPLKKDTRVSLFGRVQKDWFFTGYGSGGDVNKPYAVNLIDGIKNCESLKLNENLAGIYSSWCDANEIYHGVWGHWPRFYPEMPLTEDLVKMARGASDCAVVVIGRSSGEDRENALEKGSYYITDEELEMLNKVTAEFQKTVVLLNIGCIMDLSWVELFENKISAVMVVWQGGMESGNAVADLLSGKTVPSGKLAMTVAKSYESYPSSKDFGGKDYNNYTEDIYVGYRYFETFSKDDVQYPFGFGLSYTTFNIQTTKCEKLTLEGEKGFNITCTVTNTGEYEGKEVVQVYLQKPCDALGNPYRVLVGFKKTDTIKKGEKQEISVFVSERELASYDESGKTSFKSAYVIEKGEYIFSVGNSVRDAKDVYTYSAEETTVFEQLTQVAAPRESFDIISAQKNGGTYELKNVPVYKKDYDLKQIIVSNMPKDISMTGDKGYKLIDVKNGKVSMEDFVAQLSLEELEAISRGDYVMNSKLGVPGNAGCFAGVLPSLRAKGVPAVTTTDGPSGIRLSATCSLMPIGTLLACSFDEKFVTQLLMLLSEEMAVKGTDVLLAPGMNIHRNPLCGRNFEYFSEDPLLCGKIASAYVTGIQSGGRSACPKHFACNNQEYNRAKNDSRVSERALREIYLRPFEICVKTAKPCNIMTSYNLINGVWGHYNYELCTMILRNEWGYEGNVITDWWMKKSKSQEFEVVEDQGYRVRAQIDVFMPGGSRTHHIIKRKDKTLLASYGKDGGITLGEMQRCAMNVLRFAMNSSAMDRI